MIVSVIVPVYNVEKYLNHCVQTIVNQTYRDLEIILVDDESPDNCPHMCDVWAQRDKRITVIHKKNGGLSSVRNVGVRIAKGEFIMHLDSDDWLELDAIERLVYEQRRTGADVVWGRAMMHSPDGDVELGEPYYCNKHDWILCYSRLTANMVMTCWRRIIRKSLLIENHINAVEGCNYAEDKVQMIQIAYYAKSFSYINDIVYHYNRLNDDSLTAQGRNSSFNIDIFQQEMGSILWIENFFVDKEKIYYDEVVRAKLRHLKNKLESTIMLKSPKGFKVVKRMIDKTNSAYYNEIGFDSLKIRIVYSSYYTVRGYRWLSSKIYNMLHS